MTEDTEVQLNDTGDEVMPPGVYVDIAIRLAYEGVPTSAIARALARPAAGVRAAVSRAIEAGRITFLPANDWPANAVRDARVPVPPQKHESDDNFLFRLIRTFKLTRQQARLLAVLVNRQEVIKTAAHEALLRDRPHRSSGEMTTIKLVDVMICKLRKNLAPFSIVIDTIWARGYSMSPANQKKVMDLIGPVVSTELPQPDRLRLATACA